jgi:hypothetical protein
MHTRGDRKCRHCIEFFVPDPRNRHQQRYCGLPACRRASKAASQHKWESKPENRDYNRSAVKATKVRAWQSAHPGYWKRRRRVESVLPDVLIAQAPDKQVDPKQDGGVVLPDVWRGQSPVVIGLIAQMTGSVLPEDIAVVTGRLIARGQALMGFPA